MKIVKIKAEYIVKSDFINMLKELIKELEVDDMVSLTVEYESDYEFADMRIKLQKEY